MDVAVSEKYRTGRRLLGIDDASLMAHPEPAIQSFQDLHNRAGIAGAFRLWQKLQGMQLELHRIVPRHLPAVLEAQDLLQGQIRAHWPVRGLRASRGNPEAPVVSWQKPLQHAVGSPVAAGPCQPQFGYKAVLESFRHPLHSSLGLGREGEPHLNTQLVHGPAELS